jgi:hypothetical protein
LAYFICGGGRGLDDRQLQVIAIQPATVWAVLDYNGDFAVVPEPGTLVLLGVAAVGLLGYAWRRQRTRV